jgi:hypothetical protein
MEAKVLLHCQHIQCGTLCSPLILRWDIRPWLQAPGGSHKQVTLPMALLYLLKLSDTLAVVHILADVRPCVRHCLGVLVPLHTLRAYSALLTCSDTPSHRGMHVN